MIAMAGSRAMTGRSAMTRRAALLALGSLAASSPASAFGQAGAFHPRILLTGSSKSNGPRASACGRWAWELVRRTSAPARLATSTVAADSSDLLREPFLVWAGGEDVAPLSGPELRGLDRFFKLGGVMVVDDSEPEQGAFGRAARGELAGVLPALPVVRLDDSHVIFKTYYMIDRPVGRILGPTHVEGIVRGRYAQVIFLAHDLLGALARSRAGSWALDVVPGGVRQREYAIRLAVNLAMYVLCSDYKDDQVHAPWLMRRRVLKRP
jgi:hypothetical protein